MFVGWLIARWCVSLVTASKYLVGVRTVNLLRGAQPGNLRPEIVMSVLRGRAMEENSWLESPHVGSDDTSVETDQGIVDQEQHGTGKEESYVACLLYGLPWVIQCA